ncbi:hypothetical protein HK101_006934 [Irineochytrium annulatum]|nr:hypothetical protein HK101_006934 [Irineochytrium annulatum]
MHINHARVNRGGPYLFGTYYSDGAAGGGEVPTVHHVVYSDLGAAEAQREVDLGAGAQAVAGQVDPRYLARSFTGRRTGGGEYEDFQGELEPLEEK